ncbi:MAG TPA: CHAT domain-containing protein [Phycicoccus elongatus]|uniref:CHAT domain-containing protein n=1 Tax=Phycicoccus elongatus TaxID=101689 RepID=UPI002C362017|nr:CHAT domain-containing protein [Phycicoccus elongatus]HPK12818.1 CHAT domain-containing protein [Phycicoccus elongatus]
MRATSEELRGQAVAANGVGDYRRARRLLARAGAAARAQHDLAGLTRVAITGALTALELDGREAAERTLQEAHEQARSLADPGLMLRCAVQRAAIAARCRDWDEVAAVDPAIRPHLADLRPFEQAAVHINSALAHIGLGDPERGRAELVLARAVAATHRLPLQETKATHNLAWLDYLDGDLPRALVGLRAAHVLGSPDDSRVAIDLAQVLAEAGLIDEAEATLTAALTALGRRRSAIDRGDILIDLAQCELVRGDLTAARRHARSAALGPAVQDRRGRQVEAGLIVDLIDVIRGRHSTRGTFPVPAAGDALGQLALRVRVEQALVDGDPTLAARLVRGVEPRSGGLGPKLHTILLRARVADAQGEPLQAERMMREGARLLAGARAASGSLSLRAAMSVHARRLADYDLDRVQDRSPTRLFTAAERWRAGSMRRPVEIVEDPEFSALVGRLRQVRAGGPHTSTADDPSLLPRLEAEVARRSWEALRADTDGDVIAGHRAVAAELARTGTILMSFHVRRRRLQRVDLTSDGAQLRDLGSVRSALDLAARAAADVRDLGAMGRIPGIGERVRAGTRASVERLDRVLLAGMPRGRAFAIVPTQALLSAPWRMLPGLAGAGVVVSPSATMWLQRSRAGPGVEDPVIALIGGPGLGQAARELDVARRVWRRAAHPVRLRRTGRSDHVTTSLRDADLVHICAHGRHDGQAPLMSSLLLADGPFLAHELPSRPRASHVVLAACAVGQAEVGVGDEPLGFAAAMLARGVASVVAPTAPVDDALAEEVMVAYHRELATGESASTALQRATADRLDAGVFCLYGGDWRVR